MIAAALTSSTLLPELEEPATALVSDHFTAPVLGPQWEAVLPHEVGAVDVAATPEGEGRLALYVPTGRNHHPWTGNEGVRARQRIADDDLHLEVGFATVPYARHQLEGLTVGASHDTFLRYEVHHDGAGLRLFAARTVQGSATVLLDTALDDVDEVHLRVERRRDDWSLAWSADREEWSVAKRFSWPVVVTEAGPFAGNYDPAGNPPPFTALVDYVRNTDEPVRDAAAPPVSRRDDAPPRVTGAAVDGRAVSALLSWETSEPATSWVEYGEAETYRERSETTPVGLGHRVTMANLAPDTTYFYRIVAADLHGNEADVTGTFTTAAAPSHQGFTSDEFAAPQLSPQWQVVTPLGMGGAGHFGPADSTGQLTLSVPTGHNHNPWTANNAVRAVQPIADGDFVLETRFASMPRQRNQMQGVTIGQSRLDFIRFGVHHDGDGLRLLGSVTVGEQPTVVARASLPPIEQLLLRVSRSGDDWTLSWSAGDGWRDEVTFTQRMMVTEAGPFAGSYRMRGDAPAYTALVDYVRVTEEASAAAASSPPEVRDVEVDATTNHVLVHWSTDRATEAYVEYGFDDSYGVMAESPVTGSVHRLRLTELTPGRTYHYRVVATDDAGRTVRSPDRTFTTAAGNTGPTIHLWYGTEQAVAAAAPVQSWLNVLGNVSDADGVATLSYSLNGGAARSLAIGEDSRRLQWEGDFNADIAVTDLRPGENTVTLSATDMQGRMTVRTVNVRYGGEGSLPLPHDLEWEPGASPAEQAQVVDGAWTVGEGGLRTTDTGYDRIVALGDLSWRDYEVTVPVTVHEFGPAANTRLSGAPMIGIGLRWQGHSRVDDRQPAWGYYPTGAFAWYRFHDAGPRFELTGNEGNPMEASLPSVELGKVYVIKVQVETLQGGATAYRAKLWPADGMEPDFWELQIEEDDGPAAGSIALIAHQLHGTFGSVSVRPR